MQDLPSSAGYSTGGKAKDYFVRQYNRNHIGGNHENIFIDIPPGI
jgi:hypothetical protein